MSLYPREASNMTWSPRFSQGSPRNFGSSHFQSPSCNLNQFYMEKQTKLSQILLHRAYGAILFTATIISVFFSPFSLLANYQTNNYISIMSLVVAVIFALDMAANLKEYGKDYYTTLLFFLDIPALIFNFMEALPLIGINLLDHRPVLLQTGMLINALARSGKIMRCLVSARRCTLMNGKIEPSDEITPFVAQELRALTIRNIHLAVLFACLIPTAGNMIRERDDCAISIATSILETFPQEIWRHNNNTDDTIYNVVDSIVKYLNNRNDVTKLEIYGNVVISKPNSYLENCYQNSNSNLCISDYEYHKRSTWAGLLDVFSVVFMVIVGSHLFMKHAMKLFVRPVARMFAMMDTLAAPTCASFNAPSICSSDTDSLVNIFKQLLFELNERTRVATHNAALLEMSEKLRIKSEEDAEAQLQFLMTASHEIRTPIYGALGHAELLQLTSLDQNQQELVSSVITCGKNLIQNVNSVLDYGRLQHGNIQLEKIEFDLRDLLESIFTIANPDPKEIIPILDIDGALPNIFIGDQHRIQQVLVNLVGNSIKFTPKGGGICIRARFATENEKEKRRRKLSTPQNPSRQNLYNPSLVPTPFDSTQFATVFNMFPQFDAKTRAPSIPIIEVERSDQGLYVTLEVLDTGIGIPQEKLAKIFDPFTQADCSTTRKYGGSGLGLAICKRIVELLDGQIWVESFQSPGQNYGTKFWFTIPIKRPDSQVGPRSSNTRDSYSGCEVLSLMRYQLSRQMLDNLLLPMNSKCIHFMSLPQLNSNTSQYVGRPKCFVIADIEELLMQNNLEIEPLPIPMIILASHQQKQSVRILRFANNVQLWTRPLRKQMLTTYIEDWGRYPDGRKPSTFELGLGAMVISPKARPKPDNYLGPTTRYDVLVAEDTPLNQTLLMKQLASLGYQGFVVENGRLVLEELRRKWYKVVLLDLHMPEMDGLETAREIRRIQISENKPPIRLIALTAEVLEDSHERCLSAGMDDYLAKPVSLPQLQSALSKTNFDSEAVTQNKNTGLYVSTSSSSSG